MKICHVVPWFPSQQQNTPESRQGIFEYRHIIELNKSGHEFKVISIQWTGQTDYERINEGIEIYRIPYIFNFSKIRYPVPHLLKLTKKILHIANSWHPDIIVFSHMEYLTALPLFFIQKRVKIPIIVTIDALPGLTWFSGNRIVDFAGYLYSVTLGKLIFSRADGIHFLSRELCSVVPRLRLNPHKIFIIPRGVDTDLFKPGKPDTALKTRLGIADGDIVILYVGRLDPVKGVQYLIHAAKGLLNEYHQLKFLIVGEGGLRKDLELESAHFSKNIQFLGYRSDIPELMHISDIFLLPSLSEGAANVVLEAAATGLPVIATNVGQVPYIITDGKTGIIVPLRNVASIRDALLDLINDPEKRKVFGESGRIKVVHEYSRETISTKIINAYETIISRYYHV